MAVAYLIAVCAVHIQILLKVKATLGRVHDAPGRLGQVLLLDVVVVLEGLGAPPGGRITSFRHDGHLKGLPGRLLARSSMQLAQ